MVRTRPVRRYPLYREAHEAEVVAWIYDDLTLRDIRGRFLAMSLQDRRAHLAACQIVASHNAKG